ncbi:tetratricopeptide repeat protein [Rhizobium sp. NPDC090279]|uniref:tetratricopeptide repeat protein n=1 Tax=Rhizobium sp. NPDC090279 TaxID=3364499 RepID=UPI00383B8692
MWDEISQLELPRAKIIVIFWSRKYLEAAGCIREIKQAAGLLDSGRLRPLVLRLDDCPLSWTDDFPESTKEVFASLRSALDFRTSQENVSIDHAIELVSRVSEPLLVPNHPRLPRPELLQSMRASLQLPNDRFKFFPAAWVSGFNGIGRETIVREYNRDFVPNGRGVTIEVNEATLPRQLLLRIESEALGARQRRLEELQGSTFTSEINEVAAAIEQVIEAGNYLILRHGRIVEERIELPEWLDDVVNALEPATRGKLFIISQVPLPVERRVRCRGRIETKRVPTIDEHVLRDYCYQLVGHFDPHTERWTDDLVDQIVSAACGNVGFLVSLVRAASNIDDLDQLDALIAAEGSPMVEQMTVYTRWAFAQLAEFPDEQRTLIFLNDVSPCDVADLERVVKPSRPILRVLGKLLEYGLIEREADSLYRLNPLLANRLNRSLIQPELVDWFWQAAREFVSNPPEFETQDHEFTRIESRIQAALISGEGQLPDSIARFVSAAHWLQAGVRLYHANRRDAAYRLLKKAFEHRTEFSQTTRVEIIRYYCLSATRLRKFSVSEKCIQLLGNDHRTKSIAAFLRGNVYEFKGEFFDAIKCYETALNLNQGKDSRLEHTYRPLISCILRTPFPDFAKAQRYSLAYVELRRTIFSLMCLARVYLHWKYRGSETLRDKPKNIDKLYRDALEDLAKNPGVNSAHFEVRSEEAEFEGDYAGAIEYMDQALDADPRPLLRIERWRLIAIHGGQRAAERTLSEMDQTKSDPEFVTNWGVYVPMLSETYARALKAASKPMGLLNQFAVSMTDAEIARIIGKVSSGRN